MLLLFTIRVLFKQTNKQTNQQRLWAIPGVYSFTPLAGSILDRSYEANSDERIFQDENTISGLLGIHTKLAQLGKGAIRLFFEYLNDSLILVCCVRYLFVCLFG